jgi:hypothetical protein
MVKAMTCRQLDKACENNRYILCRLLYGKQVGLNCKISKIIQKKNNYHPQGETKVISYSPCDFNTYLNHKIPYKKQ